MQTASRERGLAQGMGGTKKLLKFIVDEIENGGKCALTLHSCISVTDEVKIKEQNTSIATGPLYLHTECSPKVVEVLNPMGYRTS